MYVRNGIIGSLVVGLFVSAFAQSVIPARAAQKTINITNNDFSPNSQTIVVGDQIKFENEDLVAHVLEIKRATDSALLHTENFAAKEVTVDGIVKDTYTRAFSTAGSYLLVLDTTIATGSVMVVESTPTPTVTPTATPEVSATVMPTASATPLPTSSPTVVPTITPIPTVAPTVSPTIVPTVAPTVTPTVVPSPTAMPTVTVTPTFAPSPTPTASAVSTPTIAPTAVPTPVVTSSPAPTVSPSQPPVPAVLPSFSVFRRTSCSAQLASQNTQVITDKLSSAYLYRGFWNIESLVQASGNVTAQVRLVLTQKISLFFGGSAFFGGNRVSPANQVATFSSDSVPGVLQKAGEAWCASQ